jgi:hypothetical protein
MDPGFNNEKPDKWYRYLVADQDDRDVLRCPDLGYQILVLDRLVEAVSDQGRIHCHHDFIG